jgi:hypothetical protein
MWESLSIELKELIIERVCCSHEMIQKKLIYRLVSRCWNSSICHIIIRNEKHKQVNDFFDAQLMKIESEKAMLRYLCQCQRPIVSFFHYIRIEDEKRCTHMNKNRFNQCRNKFSDPHTKLCWIHYHNLRKLYSKNVFQ